MYSLLQCFIISLLSHFISQIFQFARGSTRDISNGQELAAFAVSLQTRSEPCNQRQWLMSSGPSWQSQSKESSKCQDITSGGLWVCLVYNYMIGFRFHVLHAFSTCSYSGHQGCHQACDFCVFNKICQATANLVVTFHCYYINNNVHY